MRVDAAPERGRANDAVIRLLAETLVVPPRGISVLAGHTNRSKIVSIQGIDTAEAERRLDSAATAPKSA